MNFKYIYTQCIFLRELTFIFKISRGKMKLIVLAYLVFIFRVSPTRDYARKVVAQWHSTNGGDLSLLSSGNAGREDRCFERRRMENAPRCCNDYARASEKLIARSIREKPKGFGDCDVALITVNSIFLPPSFLQGVHDPRYSSFPFHRILLTRENSL